MGQQILNNSAAKKLISLIISLPVFATLTQSAKASYDCESEYSVGSKGGCPPELSGLQGIILRIVTIGITLIGILVLFLLVKAGIQIMTAGDDAEKKAKGIKQIQITILGLLGIFVAYGLIVLIAKWLGLVGDDITFIDGGRIIFNFILPAGEPVPETP